MTGTHSQIRAAPTHEAVAARAAVPRATASRVLSGATNVSSRARAAVEAAAKVRFADISAAETVGPALTTVRQPIAEIGDTMADLVIGRTSGEETTRETILPVELILRDTA